MHASNLGVSTEKYTYITVNKKLKQYNFQIVGKIFKKSYHNKCGSFKWEQVK